MIFFYFFPPWYNTPTSFKITWKFYFTSFLKIANNFLLLTWRHLTTDNRCQNSGEHYKIRHFHMPNFPKSHNSVSKPHHVKKSFYYGF